MRSIDVANIFIENYGDSVRLTNLALNKLVYFAQAESLRTEGKPLFSDEIEAWEYGPVEPAVYHAFKKFGRAAVREVTCSDELPVRDRERAVRAVESVMRKYGRLTAFDLVEFSHRSGGAWRNVYVPGRDVRISDADILASADCADVGAPKRTLYAGFESARQKWPNALRMLEDA